MARERERKGQDLTPRVAPRSSSSDRLLARLPLPAPRPLLHRGRAAIVTSLLRRQLLLVWVMLLLLRHEVRVSLRRVPAVLPVRRGRRPLLLHVRARR